MSAAATPAPVLPGVPPPSPAPATGAAGADLARRFAVLDAGRAAGGGSAGAHLLSWRRLASLQGALVDRVAARLARPLLLSGGQPDMGGDVRWRIARGRAIYTAPELLADPARYFRPVATPSHVALRRLGPLPGGERVHLTFDSTYRTYEPLFQGRFRSFAGNELNRVHLWRHHGGGGRPVALCLHAWCGGYLAVEERLLGARALYRLGLDVALPTLPFHGRRTPRQALCSGQLFPDRDLQLTNEAFGQAVADLRALVGWLRAEQGAGPVGVLGMSLGGYVAALLAALEPELAFVVPIVAPASFGDLIWDHGEGTAARAEAEAAGFRLDDLRAVWAVHCPLVHPLRTPRERVLLVRAEGDRIVPARHHEALWQHWGHPKTVSFAGGHLFQAGRANYLRDLLAWLRRTLTST